ncbi:histidine kinase [Pedococcus soli]
MTTGLGSAAYARRVLLRNASPLPRTVWGETWRLLLALAVGLVLFGIVLTDAEQPGAPQVPEVLPFLEVVFGVVALALLPFRRRFPLPVALATAALSGVSSLAVGAGLIAMVSLASHRRWRPVALAALVSVAGGLTYEALRPTRDSLWFSLLNVVIGALLVSLTISIGYYIGARRDLMASLRDRADTAEREQASRVAEARANERAQIAREMHDVLAHRISLVAMHSGALAYRSDLTPDETTRTAAVIRDNAHLALTELREVLGVLRDPTKGDLDAPGVEPPQPSLESVQALVDEERAAGREVASSIEVSHLEDAPNALSRNAFRIIQECLTNARKHAPGAPVSLAVTGAPGVGLDIRVSNAVAVPALAHPLPQSGMGLAGVTERAVLSGGELTFGTDRRGQFVVRARLPWRA